MFDSINVTRNVLFQQKTKQLFTYQIVLVGFSSGLWKLKIQNLLLGAVFVIQLKICIIATFKCYNRRKYFHCQSDLICLTICKR